jgi:hypothetical protein
LSRVRVPSVTPISENGTLAQLVELLTLNQ